MAIRLSCDGGCGAMTDNVKDFAERGYVLKRTYCPACIGEIDAMLARRDKIHTHRSKQMEHDCLVAVRLLLDELPDAVLPDAR